jgi:carbamoyl-phosphate synthase large subunit
MRTVPSRMSLDVLITAGSRRVPLLEAFRRALREARLAGTVHVTDVNMLSPTVHVADRAHLVPLSSDPGYIDHVAAICERERIRLVVPTIDDELPLFSDARERFRQMGVTVAVSDSFVTTLCNDKYATCTYLSEHGIDAAASWLPETLPARPPFPLFVKPRFGRGSVGAFTAAGEKELRFFAEYVEQPIIQELLQGPEYTIDLFCDFDGRPLSVVPRERAVIRAGVIDRGRTVRDPALINLALRCAGVLKFAGACNIQCRVVDGRPVVFEINPRFSGGIPLTIAAGADFPRMLVDLATGRTVRPSVGEFTAELWMTSYESSIFVDAARLRAITEQALASRRTVEVA